ncbi:hypothetical protein M3210_17885 [Oceanobacillus luteolus]|nr:hypothetical protein [Oceanobacillus luteolus]MCM3742110.1 hypothetical protein [Oceanobacillus luteolus]
MVQPLLNHIQDRNGSRWAEFIRKTGGENILLVAVDAAKYIHKAMICTFYGDILVKPFEFDASETGFNKLREAVRREKEKHDMKGCEVNSLDEFPLIAAFFRWLGYRV